MQVGFLFRKAGRKLLLAVYIKLCYNKIIPKKVYNSYKYVLLFYNIHILYPNKDN